MRIVLIGGNGTIGKRVSKRLEADHEVLIAGRNHGDYRVDITEEASIFALFRTIGSVDACICTASSGKMDNFQALNQKELYENMKGKLFGQINVVLIGQHFLQDGGSFTLSSGIFADHPSKGVTGGGIISRALHSFVLSAAIELERGMRINVVSPGMAADSAETYGSLFPELTAVSMKKIEDAYVSSLDDNKNGEILSVYE